jgi:hypothetical protein
MYYILERWDGTLWVSTNLILKGDYRKHICLMDTLAKDGIETRARRISAIEAYEAQENGARVMQAPKVLKNAG